MSAADCNQISSIDYFGPSRTSCLLFDCTKELQWNDDDSEGSKKKAQNQQQQEKNQGRLSAMIAQVIGNRIPSLVVHGDVVDIYQQEFTAPYFMYNSTTMVRGVSSCFGRFDGILLGLFQSVAQYVQGWKHKSMIAPFCCGKGE